MTLSHLPRSFVWKHLKVTSSYGPVPEADASLSPPDSHRRSIALRLKLGNGSTHVWSYMIGVAFQIISTDEAERRGHVYDRQGSTYLFDLDYVEDVYTVDAAHQGNVSHFVNHSVSVNCPVSEATVGCFGSSVLFMPKVCVCFPFHLLAVYSQPAGL